MAWFVFSVLVLNAACWCFRAWFRRERGGDYKAAMVFAIALSLLSSAAAVAFLVMVSQP